MSYTFKGRLCGYLCNECFEPLAKIKVRLYRLRPEQNATRLAVAEPKDTFAVLNAEQLRTKEKALLGEFETDDAGNFTAELGKGVNYEGEAFEVDVYCGTVPRRLPEPPPKGPVQFTITTVQPQWRERESSLVAAWDYCLPQRFWCYIRALFDAWVICGRVTVCATGEPAAGVKVFGFDRDWLVDDPLGFGVTDANGNFRIDYLGSNFRRGTWINIELFGGPDVYFRIESPSGDVLLNEPPSQGRTPGRENIGPCFCVDLCVEETPVVKHAWFTRVGDFALYSDINFATNGLTTHAAPFGFPGAHGGPGYGFFGNLKLVGDCPTTHPAGGEPMRYRFRYENPTSGGLQPITAANIVAVVVGSRPIMWDVFGTGQILTSQPIYVAPSGATPPGPTPPPAPLPPAGTPWGPIPPAVLVPDPNGWVTMDPAATNQGFSGPLVRFASETVVPGGTAPTSGPGVAPASPKNGTMLRIVFEAEPVIGSTISSPTLTNELTKLYVNNWSDVNDIGLTEFTGVGNTPCSGLTTDLHIKYTADHELMAAWSLGISTAATPNPVPILPSGNVPRGTAATLPLNISTWPACSYTVSLSTRRLLTDGEIEDSGHPNSLTFCKK